MSEDAHDEQVMDIEDREYEARLAAEEAEWEFQDEERRLEVA